MAWYSAHIIVWVKYKEGVQDDYPVWENIVLLEGDTDEDALSKATKRGREYEGDDDGSFTCGGRAATMEFAGVRKVIACQDSPNSPGDGNEVSYSQMTVENEESLKQLARGQPAVVTYEE